MQKQLVYLSNFINPDILLIIHKNVKENISNNVWFNIFQLKGTIIYCNSLIKQKTNIWINNKIYDSKINIHKNAKELLLKLYSGNILFLYNTINMLMLIWPKRLITIEKIKPFINNSTLFTPEEWIDSMLIGDLNKSIKILNNLFIQNYNQIVLIRSLQYNLITILMIQRKIFPNIYDILKMRKTSKSRYLTLIYFSRCENIEKINKSITLLTKIEINIKKKYETSIWNQLKILSCIISKKN
ncbi:DNA polymerase III subunit delta [Buchnera aphidicola]|uniref:DNA polymerase III subunit delta n=1 Tax=Buchnera aphidicola TaxID=9 RepID=UPI0021C9B0CB|nr:DNA polymerase III subunit delta [Buchnera aphidicola]